MVEVAIPGDEEAPHRMRRTRVESVTSGAGGVLGLTGSGSRSGRIGGAVRGEREVEHLVAREEEAAVEPLPREQPR